MPTFLARVLAAQQPRSPIDDYWYQPVGPPTATGVRMSAQTALSISTVYACVRILSQTLAMLPLIVHRRLEDGGKARAVNHPLYELLHDQPNDRQTSFQFREMLMGHLCLRGNAYAQIVPGPRGFVDQLVPLHPDRMEITEIEERQLRYVYRDGSGRQIMYLPDEIMHLSTLSDDGVKGLSLISLARESFGLAYATESYGARLFGQGARPGGILKHPGKLSADAHDHLRQSWVERYGGLQGSHKPAILEEGMEWQQIALSNEDSQFLETRAFQVEEICSWFGVPLSLVQHTEKSTSWGTGLLQLTQGFINFTMMPWFRRWEQVIRRDLILAKDTYFAEFLADGLLRGDPTQRAAFYASMVQNGIMTRNEVRIIENMNPLPGLYEPLTPLNMQRGQEGPEPEPEPRRKSRRDDESDPADAVVGNTHYRALTLKAAAQVVRKEVATLRKMTTRAGADTNVWTGEVKAFYRGHVAYVSDTLKIGEADARPWCLDQEQELLTQGIGVLEAWETVKPARLAERMIIAAKGELTNAK